ncbi:hypothetical protein [Peptoniphilus sp.]|jgi:hypothetical protein|uniref:hypothetical protein n=1 Tax=Peptoniphilus sp. TaxID=1971214 RepID=UPI003D8C4DE1
MIIFLIIFMYVFPLFFLPMIPVRMTPVFATVMLFVGFGIWIFNGFKILSIIRYPKKLEKEYADLNNRGKLVTAELLDVLDVGKLYGKATKKLSVQFKNLSGNLVKANILVEKGQSEKNYEASKAIDLKLNRDGFRPVLMISGYDYDESPKKVMWLWFMFHFVYMVVFFLVSYRMHNDGYGWRFLGPLHPFIWSGFMSIFILKFIQKIFMRSRVYLGYDLMSGDAKGHDEELILYGKSICGEVYDYQKTGAVVDGETEIMFNIRFCDCDVVVNKRFKDLIRVVSPEKVKSGRVDVIFLPQNPDIFAITFK